MLYTLLKFLGWGALLALIGGCIGWALRALKSRSEVAHAKSATVDADEVDSMRHRLANLEQVVAERDRLRIQLADVRHADSPGIVGAEIPERTPEPPSEAEPEPEAEPESPSTPDADAPTQEKADAASEGASASTDTDSADESAADAPVEPVDLDLDAATAELGREIELDDLTVVEGIGPKISELCSGIGLTTWRQLADADVADLQSMLDAAGSRYTVHKPATWPRQAELLATGQWAEFKSLTDHVDGTK